jgi:hypothetical protein
VSLLVSVGALLVLAAAFALGRASTRIRAGLAMGAREALARADLAEARLHRVAALLELRRADPEAFRTALRELEKDMQIN